MHTALTTLLAASLLAGACSARTPVSDAVRARAKIDSRVVLSGITDFQWDTVHIFGPYSSQDRVCQALHAIWTDCKEHVPPQGVHEGAFLTAFSLGGRVVHHEFHPRQNGEYCHDSCALNIPRHEAVFSVIAMPDSNSGNARFRLVRSAA